MAISRHIVSEPLSWEGCQNIGEMEVVGGFAGDATSINENYPCLETTWLMVTIKNFS